MPSGIRDSYFEDYEALLNAKKIPKETISRLHTIGKICMEGPYSVVCPECGHWVDVNYVRVTFLTANNLAWLSLSCGHKIVICRGDEAIDGAVVAG